MSFSLSGAAKAGVAFLALSSGGGIRGANADFNVGGTLAHVGADLAGLGVGAGVIGSATADMRNAVNRLSNNFIQAGRDLSTIVDTETDGLTFEDLTENFEVIANQTGRLDGYLKQLYNATREYIPTFGFDGYLDNNDGLCVAADLQPNTDSAWLASEDAIGRIAGVIFNAVIDNSQTAICNIAQSAGRALGSEHAVDRLINEVVQRIADYAGEKVSNIESNLSELSEALPTLQRTLTQAGEALGSLQNLNGPSAGELMDDIDQLVTTALANKFGDVYTTVNAAASMVAGISGMALMDAIATGIRYPSNDDLNLFQQWLPRLNALAVPGGVGVGAGITAGLVTGPLFKEWETLKSDLSELLTTENLDTIEGAIELLSDTMNELDQLVSIFANTFNADNLKQIRDIIGDTTADIETGKPLMGLCNAEENAYVQRKDYSVQLVCNIMTAIVDILEQQDLTKEAANAFKDDFLNKTIGVVNQIAQEMSDAGIDVDVLLGNLKNATGSAADKVGILKDVVKDLRSVEVEIAEDVEKLEDTLKWYVPLLAGLVVGLGVYGMVSATRNIADLADSDNEIGLPN